MEVVEKGSPVGLHLFPSKTATGGAASTTTGTIQPERVPPLIRS
jgi:hypothetical protein